MKIIDRLRDKEILLTYQPTNWKPGKLWTDHDGQTYRVTRLLEVAPTALLTGGIARCWSVRAVKEAP